MSVDAESELNRKAALDALRFRKMDTPTTSLSRPSSAPYTPPLATHYPQPPAQSRDGALTSRFWTFPAENTSRVLVPNSSPLGSDNNNYYNYQQQYSAHPPNALNHGSSSYNVTPYNHWPQEQQIHHHQPSPYFRDDPLTASSGFTVPHNYRAPNGRPISEVDGAEDDHHPRKRLNRGPPPPSSPNDPIDIIGSPTSPAVQRPGQRRRLMSNGMSMHSSASDDESFPGIKSIVDGPSRPRIIRGHRPNSPEASTSGIVAEDPRFTRFKVTMPMHPADTTRAAWDEAGGDVKKATALLSDRTWRPTHLPTSKKEAAETGRVKEVEEAHRANRAAAKEKAKKSSIYANRAVLDAKTQRASTPQPLPQHAKLAIDLTESPASSTPPQRRRRLRKMVDSESEADFEDSEPEAKSSPPLKANNIRTHALQFFNTAGIEALQELTGCSDVQAQKLIDLRPFESPDEITTKLGQTKKKAGPSGISPRIFDDAVGILEGYGEVDSILEGCEHIGNKLKAAIAAWTITGSDKGKGAALADDIQEDGALSLRSHVTFNSNDKNRYLSQPSMLADSVTLKEYQLLGVNWLHLLYNKELSCILADEMGLGKTVQVISFFALLKERGIKGPHLVVVPSSTLENWCREFARFAPSISVQTYYAGKEERPMLRQTLLDTRRSKVKDGWEVLITTYALAQGDERDRKFFKKMDWETCVFDEGHMLKNFESERYRCLLKYEARWRLLLTGTPLQNNLQELVSLMNFILPDQFAGNLETLRTIFKAKGDSKVTLLAQERVSRAKKMMTPFVLRRRKDQVLNDLPKKIERIEWCEMTPLQKTLYDDALRRSRKTVLDMEHTPSTGDSTPATSGSKGTKPIKQPKPNARKDKMYLENSANVLMDLRKAASHPMLFRSRFTDDTVKSIAKALIKEPDFKSRGAVFGYVKEDLEVMTDAELQVYMATYKSTQKYLQDPDCYLQAGKVKTLLKLMEGYMADGRRMLIFSQFTQVLDILRAVLKHQKIKYLVLTGATAVDVRQSLVDEFTEDESITVFLLSTKAGGMGINLTAASVVVMFDQDFNPHNDRQAQDRAYRIGQKRDVEVVKLITRGTVEEDMLRLGETKLALDEAVAGDPEEGGSGTRIGKVEKEMTKSLMHTLRQKFADEREEEGKEKGAARPKETAVAGSDSPLTDVDMD